ncbi:MAG TPA: hypothetical protein VNO30_32735 [Kofleriaceae bacterium]|nr:hypothetical protein [Kofleriaceae bacterium]
MDPERVGAFAITREDFARGEPAALFRLLVACAMFQRRQDQQILRILRGMPTREAAEIGSASRLLELADTSPCSFAKSTADLREQCDLSKDERGRGCCSAAPRIPCHLKRHTVAMKRYGHFGKVPTSIALALKEQGAETLDALYRSVLQTHRTRLARAIALETALCKAWRVHQKIACMFLSIVSNPDLSSSPPWSAGVDWTYFVVIDSNVDLFLTSIGYTGTKTYDARREFVCDLSRGISLRAFDRTLRDYNPRLVQQAVYLFMSSANRRSATNDCMHRAPAPCKECPAALSTRCHVTTDRS